MISPLAVDAPAFRQALAQFASGVTVVTTQGAGRPAGAHRHRLQLAQPRPAAGARLHRPALRGARRLRARRVRGQPAGGGAGAGVAALRVRRSRQVRGGRPRGGGVGAAAGPGRARAPRVPRPRQRPGRRPRHLRRPGRAGRGLRGPAARCTTRAATAAWRGASRDAPWSSPSGSTWRGTSSTATSRRAAAARRACAGATSRTPTRRCRPAPTASRTRCGRLDVAVEDRVLLVLPGPPRVRVRLVRRGQGGRRDRDGEPDRAGGRLRPLLRVHAGAGRGGRRLDARPHRPAARLVPPPAPPDRGRRRRRARTSPGTRSAARSPTRSRTRTPTATTRRSGSSRAAPPASRRPRCTCSRTCPGTPSATRSRCSASGPTT